MKLDIKFKEVITTHEGMWTSDQHVSLDQAIGKAYGFVVADCL